MEATGVTPIRCDKNKGQGQCPLYAVEGRAKCQHHLDMDRDYRRRKSSAEKTLPATIQKREVDPILVERRIRMKAARMEAELLRVEFEGEVDEDTDGSVYAIWNPAWPTRRKIGWSRDAEKRCKGYQMYSGGEDYVLEFFDHAPHNVAEAAVHALLEEKWVRGEWFEVSLEEATAAIKKVCLEHSTSGRIAA